MSHSMTRYALLAVVLMTQTLWSQPQPRPGMDRNIQMRGRSNPERDAQVEMLKQMTDTQVQLKKLEAEQQKLNTDLKALLSLATEEKAQKTVDKINELLKTRNAQYDVQLKNLEQRLLRIKTTISNYAKRNQAENRINTVAPMFTATTIAGEKIDFSQYKGKVVVLEWLNPECQFTRYAYQRGKVTDLAKQYADNENVVWLRICSSQLAKPTSLPEFIEKNNVPAPIIHDTAGQIARLYYAKSTPHFMIVGKDGRIAYSGAFDNSLPKPKDGQVTGYVANALDELLQGKPVTIPSITPAGTPINAGRLQ